MSPAVVCVPLHWCQRAGVVLSHAQKNIPMDCFGVNHLCRSLCSQFCLKKKNSMWPQAPPSSYSATSHWTGVHHKPLPLSVNFDILWITIEHLKKAEAFLRSLWIGLLPKITSQARHFEEIQNIVVFVRNVDLSFSSSSILVHFAEH